jgi:hypothetical protein
MLLSWATGGLYLYKSLRIHEEYLRQEAPPYWMRAKFYTLPSDKVDAIPMPAKYDLRFSCAQPRRNFAFNCKGCEPVGESNYSFSLGDDLDKSLMTFMTTNQIAFSLLHNY